MKSKTVSEKLSTNWVKLYYNAGVKWLKSRFITRWPFILAHAVTFACNSRCKTCSNWRMSKYVKDDLKTEEIFDLLESAHKAGMIGYYLWGGEPLIRRDIPEILDFAKQLNFLTVVNTNGSLLEVKAESIYENLDFAFVSLDYPNEYNDYIRGRKGSFEEVVKGVKRLIELGKTKITLVSTISKLNFDKMEDLANFAMEMSVGISFNAVECTATKKYTSGTTSAIKKIGLNKKELHAFYVKLLELKEKGYPLGETKTILNDYIANKPFKCHFPKIFAYVSPEGLIFSCNSIFSKPVNFKQMSFEEYFSSKEFSESVKKAEYCNVCIRTCVRTYTYTYRVDPFQLFDLINTVRIMKKSVGKSLFLDL